MTKLQLQLQLLPGPGPSSSPTITLNSLLAGSLFLPAMFDTNTLNSYLDPHSSPVTLYSCPVILFLEFQCTNLPSELGLLYSISYFSSGSPPSWGGRVHFRMKLVAFSNETVLVMLNGPLGGPVFERKFRTFLLWIVLLRFVVRVDALWSLWCLTSQDVGLFETPFGCRHAIFHHPTNVCWNTGLFT